MNSDKQIELLNQLLVRCRDSEYYRQKLPVEPIKTLEEFRRIPLTTKEDLREWSPFGLVCVPRSRLYQYHETFGTTGTPVSSWFTRFDMDTIANGLGEWGVNFNENDIVLNRFPYAISSAAHFLQVAAQHKNACVIPASSRTTVTPFNRVIRMMRKLQVTILAGLPLQMLLIAETAEMMGFSPADDFPYLRAIITAGESLSDSRRKLLNKIWNVPVYGHYGMTEFGPVIMDCSFGNAHVLENDHYVEILREDLQTEAKPGEFGNLVISTLKREATPMLRLLTGDRVRYIDKNCPCGITKCFEVRGRMGETLNAGDKDFDNWDMEEIISHFPCQRFWVAGPALDGINLIVEKEKETDTVEAELIADLENRYGTKLMVKLVPKGTLYNRAELLSVGIVGKPKYFYSYQEMQDKAYLDSARV